MNLIRELSKSYADTYRLEKRYYTLTKLIGLAGVLVGIAILLFGSIFLAKSLGIFYDASLADRPQGFAWLILFFFLIPIGIYSGAVIVASLFSLVMVCLGKFTVREAIRYSLFSSYPEYWFRKE